MAEGGTLLRCYTGNRIEGSNPSLSVCPYWGQTERFGENLQPKADGSTMKARVPIYLKDKLGSLNRTYRLPVASGK